MNKRKIPNPKRLRDIEKSVLSYGYGLKTTFIQLLAAYNVFNNDGFYITPRLAEKNSIKMDALQILMMM